jgi:tryptophan-rich sensory protein
MPGAAVLSLIVFLALTAAAAATGIQFRPGEWYETLVKPGWTPPNWLFPPVWTALYVMIAIAGWRVWLAQGLGRATIIWAIALALNAVWSYIMFGQHQIALAAIDIVALLLAIVAFIVVASSVDTLATVLFVPYLAWVSYAAALNIAIWRLN